jgi:hypothetical protein
VTRFRYPCHRHDGADAPIPHRNAHRSGSSFSPSPLAGSDDMLYMRDWRCTNRKERNTLDMQIGDSPRRVGLLPRDDVGNLTLGLHCTVTQLNAKRRS